MKISGFIAPLLAMALTAAATSVEAIPAFARKYDTNCSSCHTAYPQLNKAGRNFKEDGYAFPKLKGEESISDFLHWDEYFPASAIIISRPYDKRSNGDERMRAIHEVELMVAGRFAKNVSGFFELEAEDEATNDFGFDVGVPAAWLAYNHSKALNVAAVWGPLLAMDPYDTYSGARKLTRGTQYPIDQSFGGADNDGTLDGARQSISVFGRPMDQVFYSVGIGGVTAPDHGSEALGENPNTIYGRLAVDVTPDIMVGLLYVDGECENTGENSCTFDSEFSRFGLDAQADFGDIRLMGAWVSAEDDVTSTTSEDNDSWYLQGQYTVKRNGRPVIVPLIRYDSRESNDGNDEREALTLNVGYYFTQNIKGYLEYNDILDDPNPSSEVSRVTLQIHAAF